MEQDTADNPGRSADALKSRQIELILRQLESIPTLPEVAVRLLNLTTSSQSEMQEIVDLIQADQSLTARILSLVSRASAGLSKEVRTVGKAVLMLGLDVVRSTVLSVKVFEMFGEDGAQTEGLSRREFWKHCLAVACLSDALARRLRLEIEPEELFICGLLHDIGKLALEQCLPKSYTRVVEACNSQYGNISEYERRVLGVDHTVVGRRLAQQWHLPETVGHTIWLHHQPIDGIPDMLPERRAIAVVHLADTIAREQRFGYSGNFTFPASSIKLATQIGVSASALAETIDALPGMIEKRSRVLGMGEATTESLYRSALADANTELGRLTRRMHRRATQAKAQAEAFLLLRSFGSSLTAQESLSDLCRLLASTWVRAGGLSPSADEPVSAYVLSSSDGTVVLAADTGTDDAAVSLYPSRSGSSPVSPPAIGLAGTDVLEQLVADTAGVYDVVGTSSLSHYPLVFARRWVGGLFWSAEAATADLTGETAEALAMTMAFAVAVTEHRERTQDLADQLAQSSQKLYAAQKALAEARALAVVGEMAAGAAHEINNPLAVIAGRAQLMAESASQADRNTWQTVADQAQKISDIVTEMMEFAKPAEPRRERIAVRTIVESAVQAIRNNPDTCELAVEVRVSPNTPDVFVDPEQIQMVLVELMTNACNACATDPQVRVEAAWDEMGAKVLLRVADKGAGMDAATLDKAFSPFFSAQPAGRRRGLGLSKARRLLQLAGGKIWIASAIDEGTSVFVHLPPAEESADSNKAGEAHP